MAHGFFLLQKEEQMLAVSLITYVCSFGMSFFFIMEMAGRRKSLNAFSEHSSQICIPLWVYVIISALSCVHAYEA